MTFLSHYYLLSEILLFPLTLPSCSEAEELAGKSLCAMKSWRCRLWFPIFVCPKESSSSNKSVLKSTFLYTKNMDLAARLLLTLLVRSAQGCLDLLQDAGCRFQNSLERKIPVQQSLCLASSTTDLVPVNERFFCKCYPTQ